MLNRLVTISENVLGAALGLLIFSVIAALIVLSVLALAGVEL